MSVAMVDSRVIEDVFKGTNFGSSGETDRGRRRLIFECILKRGTGFGDGHTIRQICRELGFLDVDDTPTHEGGHWALDYARQLHAMADGQSTCAKKGE